ncbi:gamma-glutamylcyclotransferase family protein [Rhizobium sp. RCC_161_2]|uniref:gamma-glutamylcyclotransferase family protein n=1 Tax=Rhizobium sp. RCC_161_2 TaxID=3239219 RepID=UPI0035252E0D
MLIAGRWFAPMMFEPGTGLIVTGELYNVDGPTLHNLDRLESIGKPGHFRGSVEIEPVAGGDPCTAFAYFKPRSLARPIHSQYLSAYEDRRFIPPEQRGERSRQMG